MPPSADLAPAASDLFPVPEMCRPLVEQLAAAAHAWVEGEPVAAAVAPDAVEVPLARLPQWPTLGVLPPAVFAAVLRAACRRLVGLGYARATWRGPLPVREPPEGATGAPPWQQGTGGLLIGTDLGNVPSAFFAALPPGMQRHYIRDRERRESMAATAASEHGHAAAAWVMVLSVT